MKALWNILWNVGNVTVAILATIYGNPYAINLSKFLILPISMSAIWSFMPDKTFDKLIAEAAKHKPRTPSYYWVSVICDFSCVMIYAASGRWFAASVYFFSTIASHRFLVWAREQRKQQATA